MEKNEKRARHAQPPPASDQTCCNININELPDEMLVNIVSSLEVKEGARTCVLSRRWRNLWSFSTSLDFDATDAMRLTYNDGSKTRKYQAHKYIEWVNHVLNIHKGSTVERLRIAFDMHGYGYSIRTSMDKWVDFAIFKRVQRLELDLNSVYGSPSHSSAYTFPSWLLDIPVDQPTSFDRLTALCLKSVSISDASLAYVLSTTNCLLLEMLVVENAELLRNVRVSSESALKLIHLEIRFCWELENVEISTTNLAFFKYSGKTINMCIRNAPKLSSISLGYPLFSEFPTDLHLCRPKKLELDLICAKYDRWTNFPRNWPEFSNLEQLELKFRATQDDSLLCLSSIIAASPCLRKLTLKYEIEMVKEKRSAPSEHDQESGGEELAGAGGGGGRYTHQCLKVIEFVGWVGLETDVQLANYLIASAKNLEKISFDLRIPHFMETSWSGEFDPIKGDSPPPDREAALSRAMQLEKKLSPGAKLILI